MPVHSLPIVDLTRTEFGFARSVCACPACVRFCRHMPGYLIPADLDRIRLHVGSSAEWLTWAAAHLRASPGALVMRASRVFRIPTLVPARRTDGGCIFLTA